MKKVIARLKLDGNTRKQAILCILALLVVVFALWFLSNLSAHQRRATDDEEAARLSEMIRNAAESASPVQAARGIAGNEDIVAYIEIPGTSIRYAVAHGADNEFYLHHDLRRRPNENGSIFLDYLNSPDFTDRSTIIYGHNRQNGTKFYDLQLFQDLPFFETNKQIFLRTMDDDLVYEVFAVFVTHINFQYIQVEFRDEDDFLELVHEMQRRSMHPSDVMIAGNDRILILSTCTGIGPTGRLVVVGRYMGLTL